jgi:hypothetical protein
MDMGLQINLMHQIVFSSNLDLKTFIRDFLTCRGSLSPHQHGLHGWEAYYQSIPYLIKRYSQSLRYSKKIISLEPMTINDKCLQTETVSVP